MKKAVIVIAMLLIAALSYTVNAQIATLNLREGQTYVEYTTDVTLTNSTAQYFLINAPQPWYTAQAVTVDMDSLAGDHTNVNVALSGRVSDLMDWTAITNVDWDCNNAWPSTDCTMVILNATEVPYRQFKITFTGTGTGTTTIANMEFKQYYGLP